MKGEQVKCAARNSSTCKFNKLFQFNNIYGDARVQVVNSSLRPVKHILRVPTSKTATSEAMHLETAA